MQMATVPTAAGGQAALIVFLIRLTELYNRTDEQKGAGGPQPVLSCYLEVL
jgi:hypothetical protein